MKRVLLLSLSNSGQKVCDQRINEFRSRQRLWNTPNLSLLTVGAMLPKDWEIHYVDLAYESVQEWTYDMVFMSPSTTQSQEAYGYACQFRDRGARIVMGGPHASVCPDEVLQYADVVFAGEAEDTMRQFLREWSSLSQKKMYRASTHPNLGQSPVPLYSLAVKYPYSSIPIQWSRGCPHQCHFCSSSSIYGKRIRRKSLGQLKAELEMIQKCWKRPFLFFTDDNLFIEEQSGTELLSLLQQFRLDWYGFTDVSLYEKEKLCRQLRSSGCRKVLIGFESLNPANLAAIQHTQWKKRRLEQYWQAISVIQREGIGVIGSFVLGLDEDEASTFERLYQFIYDSCLYGTNLTIATPYPGTRYYEQMKREGRLLTEDWSRYDGFTLVHSLPKMTRNVFMDAYDRLIERINSTQRLQHVVEYFKRIGERA